MNLKQHHLSNHANRGLGEDPASCPICPHEHPELVKRLEALEGKAPAAKLNQVATMVIGSVIAAYFVERYVRGRK